LRRKTYLNLSQNSHNLWTIYWSCIP